MDGGDDAARENLIFPYTFPPFREKIFFRTTKIFSFPISAILTEKARKVLKNKAFPGLKNFSINFKKTLDKYISTRYTIPGS